MEISQSQIPEEKPVKDTQNSKHSKKSFLSSLMASSTLHSSFKEESYFINQLKPTEKRALDELKSKLSSALPSDSIWGISLLVENERRNVVLLKFLRARDFKVSEAFTMLHKCLDWRKEYRAETIVEEDLGFKEFEGIVAYMHGNDREGHPVCYNSYAVFKDKDVYEKAFGNEENLKKFLRWRVQVLERGVKSLHFKPGEINSMIQVTDLKDIPKRELRTVSNQILSLFQDNYPEMVARKIFINVPWYFSFLYSMFSHFLTLRTKSKFVIANEGNVTEILYRFIKPENVPVQYGGLSRPEDLQNGSPKPASEFTVKGGERVNLEIDGIEEGSTIQWDIVVGGWELDYSAEFEPNAAGSYTISIEKPRWIKSGEDPIHNSFASKETGKLVISIDNSNSRRKKVAAYRYFVRKQIA